MTRRSATIAVWYEIRGQRQAHAMVLHDQPFQRLSPSEAGTAICGAEVPEGSPVQFDSDFHDCATCKAALNQKVG